MRITLSPKVARSALSPRRLCLLASAAIIAGAMLLTSPGGYLEVASAPLVAPAHAAATAGPSGFADIVQKVKSAVVSVRVKLKGEESSLSSNDGSNDGNDLPLPFRRVFRQFGLPDGRERPHVTLAQGSAFFISPDGYAVTNNHVVDNAESVEIRTDDGKTYAAKVIGTDPKTDVALIKVNARDDLPYVKFSDTSPRVGDWVVTVGNPYGLGGTVTAGIVSARGRDIGAGPYDDFIQIDAPITTAIPAVRPSTRAARWWG